MREIKFRAWDTRRKEFRNDIFICVDGKIYSFSKETPYGKAISYVNEEFIKLMQYTGFKDVNDKEIYDGDILDFTIFQYGGNDSQDKGYVVIEEVGIFIKTDFNDDEFTKEFDLVEAVINDDELKVIGNIYENPELLEEC